MKKYTFKINNTANANINPSNTYSEILSDIISSNIKKNNPWFADFEETPKRAKNININIDITRKPKKTYTYDSIDYGDIFDAIKFIYDYKREKPSYDFKLYDGTPVKMFSDEIQIGYDLIPLNNFTKAYYDLLSEDTRKHIIDIYIDIKHAA